jgi:cytochrome c-type biogenesis protein CcmH
MTGFLAASILATIAAVAIIAVPLLRRADDKAPVAGLLVAAAFPVAVITAYAIVSDYPWSAPRDTAGWRALGDSHMMQERFAEARDAYQRALQLSEAADDELSIAFAEAAILNDSEALQGEAGRVIEEVLKRTTDNPRALWYGGLMALAQSDRTAARERWGRLLELSPPPAVRQILEQQLAILGGQGTAAPGPAPAGGEPTRLSVRVSLAPGLQANVKPGATLFLIARAAGTGGAPLAVLRREAGSLPADLEISDSDSMLPGSSLGGHDAIELTARISNGGDAIAAPGDLYGDLLWRREAGGGKALEILIDSVVD